MSMSVPEPLNGFVDDHTTTQRPAPSYTIAGEVSAPLSPTALAFSGVAADQVEPLLTLRDTKMSPSVSLPATLSVDVQTTTQWPDLSVAMRGSASGLLSPAALRLSRAGGDQVTPLSALIAQRMS